MGQEPADPDHPARRGLHLGGRDRRGARGEGDEPRLTAEALAERLGDMRARTTTTLSELAREAGFASGSALDPASAGHTPEGARFAVATACHCGPGSPERIARYARLHAPGSRRRQHPDRARPLRRRAARRPLATRDGPDAHGRRARRSARRAARPRRGRRDLPLDDRADPRARVGAARRPLGARRSWRSGPGSRPGSRSATTTRARSAPTGSSTPWPRRRATARR